MKMCKSCRDLSEELRQWMEIASVLEKENKYLQEEFASVLSHVSLYKSDKIRELNRRLNHLKKKNMEYYDLINGIDEERSTLKKRVHELQQQLNQSQQHHSSLRTQTMVPHQLSFPRTKDTKEGDLQIAYELEVRKNEFLEREYQSQNEKILQLQSQIDIFKSQVALDETNQFDSIKNIQLLSKDAQEKKISLEKNSDPCEEMVFLRNENESLRQRLIEFEKSKKVEIHAIENKLVMEVNRLRNINRETLLSLERKSDQMIEKYNKTIEEHQEYYQKIHYIIEKQKKRISQLEALLGQKSLRMSPLPSSSTLDHYRECILEMDKLREQVHQQRNEILNSIYKSSDISSQHSSNV